jgi:O-antigen ligase
MIIIPLLYLSTFILAVSELYKGKNHGVLLFIIFGLPIYVTTLSIVYSSGFESFMSAFQLMKEVIVVFTLILLFLNIKSKIRLHFIDYLIIGFFCYTLLYVIIPIGEHDIINRIIAFKNTSFFALLYFTGRILDPRSIFINKYFHFILIMSILACIVLIGEVVTNQHLQLYTGFADYNVNFLNFEASGDEGLTFTFETENGLKRFASFFSNPLEYAAATLLALSVIAAIYTKDDNKFKLDTFGFIALISTLIAILFTISRAAFVSYFIVIYVYAWITYKRKIIHFVNFIILCGLVLLFIMNSTENIQKFIINTINFTDSSSIGHVLDWIEGITAINEKPLGLGLGASGRVAVTLGTNTGGHNQFLIVGVQTGIIAMLIYLALYFSILITCWKWLDKLKGKARQVCLILFLVKIGLFIPLFTSEIEASPYISYFTWFLTGFFINIVADEKRTSYL